MESYKESEERTEQLIAKLHRETDLRKGAETAYNQVVEQVCERSMRLEPCVEPRSRVIWLSDGFVHTT